MKVAVVSSCYGGYDSPIPPTLPQTMDAEWVLVSEQAYDVPPWRTVVEPRSQLHPRLAAKVAKCRPDLYADADVHIWVDASFAIISPNFVSWCVSHVADGQQMAQIPHPERKRLTDEAAHSAGLPKYAGLPIHEQAARYLDAGYPDDWGLWATGLIVYRGGTPIGDQWLREQLRFTYHDQISEAPLLYAFNVRPVDMGGGLLHNPHFRIRGHRDHM